VGLIARQSFKAGILTYVGVALGVINNILIYPFAFSVEEYGEIQFVIQTATFFTPFLLIGLGSVLNKYFPQFNEGEKRNGFYSLIYLIILANSLLFLGGFVVFQDAILHYYNVEEFRSSLSISVLIGISVLLPFVYISQNFSALSGRIALPSGFIQLLKVVLPSLALFYYADYLSFDTLVLSILGYYIFLVVLMLFYAHKQQPFKPTFQPSLFKQVLSKEVGVFALFSLLSGIGGTLTNQIDILMITGMKGTYANGLYTWSLFIANAIALPYGILASIATPLISRAWKEGDTKQLTKIYQQSSSTLLVISGGLFLVLWAIVDDVYSLMPKGEQYGSAKYVLLLLIIAKLIDLGTGLNNQIISMSKGYKMLLYYIMGAAILNIGLNFFLIPNYGLIGSAMATIASIVLYNALKYIFLLRRYQLQPWSKKTAYILVVLVVFFLVVGLTPKTDNSLLNIAVMAPIVFAVYGAVVYKLRLSQELNDFVNRAIKIIGWKNSTQ
jgi:O-antigen/teichoic acid export membrane protein